MLLHHDIGEAVANPHACTTARRSLPARSMQGGGSYNMPQDVQERLRTALADVRNREAAERLAAFLGRYWSSASRLGSAYPIDRRALADHEHLGLTEAQIRGAIRALERIGFLARDLARGSRYKATDDGLRRKPILFRFGLEFAALFDAANRRAERARHRQRPPAAVIEKAVPIHRSAQPGRVIPWSPKDRNRSETKVLMGDRDRRPAGSDEAISPLERALRSWGRAIEMEQTGTA